MRAMLHHHGPFGKQPPRRLKHPHEFRLRFGVGCSGGKVLLPQIAGFGRERGEVGRHILFVRSHGKTIHYCRTGENIWRGELAYIILFLLPDSPNEN